MCCGVKMRFLLAYLNHKWVFILTTGYRLELKSDIKEKGEFEKVHMISSCCHKLTWELNKIQLYCYVLREPEA